MCLHLLSLFVFFTHPFFFVISSLATNSQQIVSTNEQEYLSKRRRRRKINERKQKKRVRTEVGLECPLTRHSFGVGMVFVSRDSSNVHVHPTLSFGELFEESRCSARPASRSTDILQICHCGFQLTLVALEQWHSPHPFSATASSRFQFSPQFIVRREHSSSFVS